MTRIVSMAAVVMLLGGCAHAPLDETVIPYQGEPQEGARGVTFDGGAFHVPRQGPVEREMVQALEFRPVTAGTSAGSDTADAGGLTPLVQGLVERGRQAAAVYPGVGGVILVDDGEFVYRGNGTNFYRYHFAGLVLKEDMKGWAHLTLGFTEGRSRARVLFARSVTPDGTVQALDPAAMEVGSPSEDEQFFNPNRRVLSGVIPGVEVGSIVEYSYEMDQYNPEDPRLFFPGYFFQGTEPVVLSRVAVRVPESITFNYATRHFPEDIPAEPIIEKKDGIASYTWVAEDMPPVVEEPMMPPLRDVTPLMDGSIFKSFEEVYELERGLQQARIAVTPGIESAAKEITAGAATVDEKLARLYHWVQTNTRYISIKGSLGAGWSGHTAQETFENRYGDCTDKAILFATMCKAIGVTSYPIVLMTNDQGTGVTEIPTLDANHCINEVCLEDGRSFYLDSTAQDYRYPFFRADDHGAFAVNAIRGDTRQIPVPPPEDNGRWSHLDVTLDVNGDVRVKTRNTYVGTYEAGVRGYWKSVRDDERPLRMASYVNSISPGAVLDDFTLSDLDDLSQQLSMNIDYALPGHAIRARGLLYMRMPTLDRDFPEVALETRRYPIQYMTTEQRILEIDVTLPKGARVRWLPPPLDIGNPYVTYQGRYEEAEGVIRLRTAFRALQRIVPPEDYPAYRDALRAIAAWTKKEIFLTVEE